jgi:nitrogen fixation NifU-like protein
MMSAAVKGKNISEVRKTIATFKPLMSVHEAQLEESDTPEPEPIDLNALGELAALQGVVKFPVRIKCATLSWNTLAQTLDDAGV